MLMIFLIPLTVKADMGAPMIKEYTAIVNKVEGADYYDYEYDDYEYLYSSSHTYRYNDDYFSVLLSNIEIDDARIISILHDAYTSQVDFFIDNGYVKSSYAIIPVTFCCNGNEYSRKIFLNMQYSVHCKYLLIHLTSLLLLHIFLDVL